MFVCFFVLFEHPRSPAIQPTTSTPTPRLAAAKPVRKKPQKDLLSDDLFSAEDSPIQAPKSKNKVVARPRVDPFDEWLSEGYREMEEGAEEEEEEEEEEAEEKEEDDKTKEDEKTEEQPSMQQENSRYLNSFLPAGWKVNNNLPAG